MEVALEEEEVRLGRKVWTESECMEAICAASGYRNVEAASQIIERELEVTVLSHASELARVAEMIEANVVVFDRHEGRLRRMEFGCECGEQVYMLRTDGRTRVGIRYGRTR